VTENAISKKDLLLLEKIYYLVLMYCAVIVSLLTNSLQGLSSCCDRLCHHFQNTTIVLWHHL